MTEFLTQPKPVATKTISDFQVYRPQNDPAIRESCFSITGLNQVADFCRFCLSAQKFLVQRYSCLLIAILLCCCAGNAGATSPNIILFFVDDLGYGDVGYQGGDIPTPHIDSIANNGVQFTDGYVTCPVCAPSRAGLLTGRYQQRFGFGDNLGPYQREEASHIGIPPTEPILSDRLRALGYSTGLFGKTHDGSDEEQMAFSRWDQFFGFNNGASNYLAELNRAHNPIFNNRTPLKKLQSRQSTPRAELIDNGTISSDKSKYLTDSIGDAAVRFIDANKKKPFLCYVPFNAIHGPFQAPQHFVQRFRDEPDQKRRLVKAMLYALDQNVGKILQCVRNHRLQKQTLIIFLSDNGGHDHSPNTPLRGKKGTLWEGGIRIPFCMQWQGVIPEASMYNFPVSSLDILPTAVAAAGGTVLPQWNLDGVNLLPFVCQKSATNQRPHQKLYWSWGPRRAIRNLDYKLLTSDSGKSYQLFDLATDMSESTDLIASHPEIADRLRSELQKWQEQMPPNNSGWNPRVGPKRPDFAKPQPYHQPVPPPSP